MPKGKRLTTHEFIERAKLIHNGKYDYSSVGYINNVTPVLITCPYHSQFYQRPDKHLIGQGCSRCSLLRRVESRTYTTDVFIKLAREVHGDTYDYSLVNYRTGQTKVDIICPEGHIFSQSPAFHLQGQGCLKCYQSQWNNGTFIQKAKLIHGEKYDYSKVEYINDQAKVQIICPPHGSFRQRASAHLYGQGCPVCRISSGEREIERILQRLRIEYSKQKCFDNCMLRLHLPFDFHFVIGNHTFLVEYDGEQHFGPVSFYGGKKQYELRKRRDSIKTAFAASNGFILIRIPYTQFDNIETILTTEIQKYR